jgi:hypothetical protein
MQASLVASPQQVALQGPYAYPCFTAGCTWDRARGAARIALLNPNSGPGSAVDANWQRLLADMRANGALMLAYIDSAGGSKSLAAAKAEVAKYWAWYPTLAGVFVDGVSSSCGQVAAYQALVGYVRSLNPSAMVVFNWGASAWRSRSMSAAVVVCA